MRRKLTMISLKIMWFFRERFEKIKYRLKGIKSPAGKSIKWVKEGERNVFDLKKAFLQAAASVLIWIMMFGTLILEFSSTEAYVNRIKSGFGIFFVSLCLFIGTFIFMITYLKSRFSYKNRGLIISIATVAGAFLIDSLVYITLLMNSSGELRVSLEYAGYYIALMFLLWTAGYYLKNILVWILFPLVPIMLTMPPAVPGWDCFAYLISCFLMILLFRQFVRVKDTGFKDARARILLAIAGVAISLIVTSFVLLRPALAIARNPEIYEKTELFVENRLVGIWEDMIFRLFNDNTAVVDEIPPAIYDEIVCDINTKQNVTGNLYQKAIVGTNYENGVWTYDTKDFKRACKEADLNSKKVSKEVENHIFKLAKDLNAGNDVLSLKIKYQKARGRGALVPVNTYVGSGKNIFSDAYVKRNVFKFNKRYKVLNTGNYTIDNWNDFIDEITEADKIWDFYDAYVRKEYLETSLSVPSAKEAADMLVTPFYGGSASVTNKWRYKMAEKVATYLVSGDYAYDMPSLNGSVDATEYFLTHGMRGTADHFATAGVLILREMGIPARYVEGYVINGVGFSQKKNGTYKTTVLDRDRHSWVEVYLNHVGWVTVEMTPSYKLSDDKMITGQETKYLRLKPEYLEGGSLEGSVYIESPDGEDGGQWGTGGNEASMESKPEITDEYGDASENVEIMDNLPDGDEPLDDEKDEYEEEDSSTGETEYDVNEKGKEFESNYSDEASDDPNASDTNENTFLKVLGMLLLFILWGLSIVLLMIIVYTILITLLKLVIKKSYSRIDDLIESGKNRKALLLINRSVYKSLKLRGRLLKRNPSDEEFEEALKNSFKDISNQSIGDYMEAARKARFADANIELSDSEGYIGQFIYHQTRLFRGQYWSRMYLIETLKLIREKLAKKR